MEELKLFKKYYPKEWIDQLLLDYNNYYNELNTTMRKRENNYGFNSKYFNSDEKNEGIAGMGSYPREKSGKKIKNSKEINDHFNNLLYICNIDILHFVIKNIDIFKDKVFLDNGSGFGCLLSIFLKKLNIKCYNYDNFDQIGLENEFNNVKNAFFDKYGIEGPKKYISEIPIQDIQVLTTSGMWVDNTVICNHDFEISLIDNLHCYRPEDRYFKYKIMKPIKTYKSFNEIFVLSDIYAL
tara:strand:- start:3128 stop:3844 length:717 start_codon:yes stop_codon:yes gene_type:complete